MDLVDLSESSRLQCPMCGSGGGAICQQESYLLDGCWGSNGRGMYRECFLRLRA